MERPASSIRRTVDLFELGLDKMTNQYETLKPLGAAAGASRKDEATRSLKN